MNKVNKMNTTNKNMMLLGDLLLLLRGKMPVFES